MSEKKKLSRFERKFKRARKKGKETFKYRKNRLNLLEKRGVDSTLTNEELEDKNNMALSQTVEKVKKKPVKTHPGPKKPGEYKMGGRVRNSLTEQYD